MKKYIQPEIEFVRYELAPLLDGSPLQVIDDNVTAEEDDEVLTGRFEWGDM